ncbi:MAG: ATP-binding protein [Candidatus Aenigmatarchaeota archaeon]
MLEEINPWWKEREWWENDYDLKKFENMKIKWLPEWIDKISLEPFSLNFVLGPRQVGKTTGIKLLIKSLIEEGENPRTILYVNCDLLTSFKELRNLLEKSKNYKTIFLDEVSSIEYWWKVVKGFIDAGFFAKSTITISGSSSLKVGKFVEAFSGRRGKGREIFVLPLTFKEFFQILNYKKEEKEVALEDFIRLGGFPRSINQDPTFFQDFVSSIEKEFARINKNYRIAREIIYQLLLKTPSPLGYNTIGNAIGISHVTVREYLEILENLFLIGIAYYKKGKTVDFKKEKKIFFRDPFIPKVFSKIFGVELRKDAIYEWIVQDNLLRKFGEVYYFRNRYEIDCIAGDLKIEVKAGKPHRAYPKDVIILDKEDLAEFLLK